MLFFVQITKAISFPWELRKLINSGNLLSTGSFILLKIISAPYALGKKLHEY